MDHSVEISVVKLMAKARKDFEDDFNLLEMHRFPAGLRGLGYRYIVPKLVAIGPYHHDSHHLQKMEVVKRAAASHLSGSWGSKTSEEVYKAVLGVAKDARKLYAAIDRVPAANTVNSHHHFAEMMFFDACFLLHYMEVIASVSSKQDAAPADALSKLLFSNRGCIDSDIMLLENQLPWLVVETIVTSLPEHGEHYIKVVGRFIARTGRDFNIVLKVEEEDRRFVWEEAPPHLLGLLRLYKTGKDQDPPRWPRVLKISEPSAIELAEIGIKLRASVTSLFKDMDVTKNGPFCGKLSLAPLSLNDTRACCLVNMAAFEVATCSSYAEDANRTAVCSYLALFSMFMHREDDVHELRAKRILHGHRTNKEMLAFFKGIVKHLPDTGSRFANIMFLIEDYKQKRWMWIKVHKLVYNHYRTIFKIVTILSTLAGIFQALLAINKVYHHN